MEQEIVNQRRASYEPESNKIRLYIGRVPRDEYERLRAEGWTSTPKQGCDFVATWTPQRRDTALEYADIIEDEDQGPAERAADRAERFSEYRDKRTGEAVGGADRFDAGPQAHGYQSEARAERMARRHDRVAGRAVDAWGKAEYWQRRTAGVISHALYKALPGVRMGRIKTLEASLRRFEGSGSEWETHYRMRLLYENQMLEAEGGRAASIDIMPGGRIGGKLIVKVNKSSVTGRVVSVAVKDQKREGWRYRTRNVAGTDYALTQIETERLPQNAYTAPTEESLAELAALKTAAKASAPKKPECPLVNPTDEDAARLQAIWNEVHKRGPFGTDREPAEVRRMSQAQYSLLSLGSFGSGETQEITGGGFAARSHYMQHQPDFPAVAKVRRCGLSVIVLTDKPQKPIPASVWHDPRPAVRAEVLERFDELQEVLRGSWLNDKTSDARQLLDKAWSIGLAYVSSQTQFGLTDEGVKIAAERRAKVTA